MAKRAKPKKKKGVAPRIGVVAGSLDPITVGHLGLIRQGLESFHKVVVGVGSNIEKNSLFSKDERVQMARDACAEFGDRVEVLPFDGLLVDFVNSCGAHAIIRGLRSNTDLDKEAQMAGVNRRLYGKRYGKPLETVFFWTLAEHSCISSTVVRDLALNGGSAEELEMFVLPRLQNAFMRNLQLRGPRCFNAGFGAEPLLAFLRLTAMNMRPGDFGPLYSETVLGRFPVEPWNTVSNLVFLVLVIYWSMRLRGSRNRHLFLRCSLPVLFIGWVGGTVFHATRSHNIWLLLDFIPIGILALASAIYLWYLTAQTDPQRFRSIGIPLAIGAISLLFARHYGRWSISAGYFVLALFVLLPGAMHAWVSHWRNAAYLLGSALLFGMALLCRILDSGSAQILPMGTHFLWHLLGGTSVHCLITYLFYSGRSAAAATREASA